jgi:hypothetical protein
VGQISLKTIKIRYLSPETTFYAANSNDAMFLVALRPDIKNLIPGVAEVPEVTGRSYQVIKKICKELFYSSFCLQ